MSDGARDAANLNVDTSERGIAISRIAALGRERLLVIAWAAYDAGLLNKNLQPHAATPSVSPTAGEVWRREMQAAVDVLEREKEAAARSEDFALAADLRGGSFRLQQLLARLAGVPSTNA